MELEVLKGIYDSRAAQTFASVKRAMTEPLCMIVENAVGEGAIVLGKINDSKDNNFGKMRRLVTMKTS